MLDRAKAATVDFAAVTSPVLTIAGEYDRLGVSRITRQTAARYQTGTYVEILGLTTSSFFGAALPVTIGRIDDWIANNRVLSTA